MDRGASGAAPAAAAAAAPPGAAAAAAATVAGAVATAPVALPPRAGFRFGKLASTCDTKSPRPASRAQHVNATTARSDRATSPASGVIAPLGCGREYRGDRARAW